MCSLCICSRSTFFPYFFCCTILIMNARKRERKHITMFCLLQLSFTKWQETKSERERERDKPVDSEKINRKRHVRFFSFFLLLMYNLRWILSQVHHITSIRHSYNPSHCRRSRLYSRFMFIKYMLFTQSRMIIFQYFHNDNHNFLLIK